MTAPERTDDEASVVVLNFLQRPKGPEVKEGDKVVCTDGMVQIKDGEHLSMG